MTDDELRTAHSAARAAAAAVRPIPKVAPVVIPQQSLIQEADMPYDQDRQPWSGSSGVYIDESIINQIDFSEPARPPVSAVGPPPVTTFHVEAFESQPHLVPTSSQSSSSGGDISLPPTPVFNPADVERPNKGWMEGKVDRPDLLHAMGPLSPVPAAFSLN